MMRRRRFLQAAAAGVAVPSLRAQARPRLVFIHGRAQGGRAAGELESSWTQALVRGAGAAGRNVPAGIEVAMPFYGDLLDGFARASEIPLTADIRARGTPPDREFLAFQADFAEALRLKAGVSDAQVQAEYAGSPQERGPQNWQWVQATLRALDRTMPGMGEAALEAFTRDVFLYITRPGVRTAIDRIVSAALSAESTVIVSHSLGTVVAYSVLSTDARPLRVPLLVTLGSPLAVRAVRDPFRPIAWPPSVGNWYNAFDTRDVVSLYPLDDENFPVGGAIANNPGVRNHTSNRHGIAGYLDDADVARRVLDALGA